MRSGVCPAFAASELLLSQLSAPFLCYSLSPANKWWWSKKRDLYPCQVLVLVFQCELPFAAAVLCRVASQALICPLLPSGVRGLMAEDRAEAVCPGLGKTLSSRQDRGISLSTVSVYQRALFYANTCAEIN